MTTDLEQACTDLAAWLPRAAALITHPDTDGTRTRTAPGSKPPWNAQAANAVFDVHAAIREVEQILRQSVTQRPAHFCRRPGWSDGNTLKALQAVPRLAAAADEDLVAETVDALTRYTTTILQLPAIDLEERPLRPDVPCPRCNRKMLRYWQITGTVACLGCQQKASLQIGYVSGQPILRWDDGEITFAPPLEGTTP